MAEIQTEEFLQKYKELEQLIIKTYPVSEGNSAVWALGDVKEFVPFRPQLTAIREIRNFLSHTPTYDSVPLVLPSEGALKIINNIIAKIEGPKSIYTLCIKPNGILCAKMDDAVAPVVKLMRERCFQVLPIMENGRVTAVYFDSAAVHKEIDNGDLDDATTFFQLKKYIDLQSHIDRDVLFMAKDSSIERAKEAMTEHFKKGNRIGAIFVTERGKSAEALLGLVLPYQLI